MKKTIVVMTAHNNAHVLNKTYEHMPKDKINEIVLVDDASTDNTHVIAEKLGMRVVRHPKNRGYGGAQKTGYKEAILRGADIVVLLHADNQYDPSLLNGFIEKIETGDADVVTGSRIAYGNVVKDGMPIWKYIANILLTRLENIVFRAKLSDFHNGYRAYSSKFLRGIPFEEFSDKFDFDTDIIIQACLNNARIAEIPHKTRYEEENSKMSFSKGIFYGLSILKTIILFLLNKMRVVKVKKFQKKA